MNNYLSSIAGCICSHMLDDISDSNDLCNIRVTFYSIYHESRVRGQLPTSIHCWRMGTEEMHSNYVGPIESDNTKSQNIWAHIHNCLLSTWQFIEPKFAWASLLYSKDKVCLVIDRWSKFVWNFAIYLQYKLCLFWVNSTLVPVSPHSWLQKI